MRGDKFFTFHPVAVVDQPSHNFDIAWVIFCLFIDIALYSEGKRKVFLIEIECEAGIDAALFDERCNLWVVALY